MEESNNKQETMDNEMSITKEQPVVDAFKATGTTFEALGVSGETLKAIQERGDVARMLVKE